MLWITADMLAEGSEKLLDKAIIPAVDMLQSKSKIEPAAVSKHLVTELNRLRKRNPSLCAEQTLETCGCESTGEAPPSLRFQ